jgi:YfiH family protein
MNHVIEPPNIAPLNIRAFFTTRDFSADNEIIADALAQELNISAQNIYLPLQRHTDSIHIFDGDMKPTVADAVITGKKDVLIGVIVADCVPILLFDPSQEVIAAVHAGWRGTADGILEKTIDRMESNFGCRSDEMLIAIGPSIRQCSYEVGEDVKEAVEKKTGEGEYFTNRGEKYHIDLSIANRLQAVNSGVVDAHIWQSKECTYCNPSKYHSYRYSGASSGRQGGFIGMW